MRAALQVSGTIAVVLLFFGLVAYLFNRDLGDPYVLAHLGLGGLCLAIYLATHGGALVRSVRRRAFRSGLREAFYCLSFFVVLGVINVLGFRYHARWDLSEAQIHTLTPQSARVLDALEREVEIYGFFERGEHRVIAGLMRRYLDHSPKVKFYPIDPERRPELAEQFHVQRPNTIHIRYGKESMSLTDPSEAAVTNAIAKLSRETTKSVYFLTGHGEADIDDRQTDHGYGSAKEALESDNYRVHKLLLAAEARVPEKASVVIAAGTQKPLLEHELKTLDAYIKNGGRLLILLPSRDGESLGQFLQEWGVVVGNDLVLDQVIRLFAGPSLGVQPIAEAYSSTHPITRGFTERTIFPMVRSVEPAASPKDGIMVTPLVRTSPSSWAERDLVSIFQKGKASLGAEDKKGPVTIGVAISADLRAGGEKGGEAKLVVLGTAEFANNRFLDLFFNRDFFLSAVNWLAGEDAVIGVRPGSLRPSRVQLTQAEGRIVFYVSFLAVPEIVLLIGLVVWWKRR
jgi:ABC-type uncharacterized transport system involved in gliding motility auxiliary subunit